MQTVTEHYRHVTIPADLNRIKGDAILAYMGDVKVSGYRIQSKSVIEFCIPDDVPLPSPLKVVASGLYDRVLFDGYVLPHDRVSYGCPCPLPRHSANHDAPGAVPSQVM